MISLRGEKDSEMLHVIWRRYCCWEPQERLLKSDKKSLCSRSTHPVAQRQKVLLHPVGNFQKCTLKGNFLALKHRRCIEGCCSLGEKQQRISRARYSQGIPNEKVYFVFCLIPRRHAALWLINAGGEVDKRAFWCQDPAEDGRQMLPSGRVVCDRILLPPRPTNTDSRKPIY